MCSDMLCVMKIRREWEIIYLLISRSLFTLKIFLQAQSCRKIREFCQGDRKSYERPSQIVPTWSLLSLRSHEWMWSPWWTKGTILRYRYLLHINWHAERDRKVCEGNFGPWFSFKAPSIEMWSVSDFTKDVPRTLVGECVKKFK